MVCHRVNIAIQFLSTLNINDNGSVLNATCEVRIDKYQSDVQQNPKTGECGCFKYLGSMLANDGRRTCEIKSRIAMAKAAFNKKNIILPVNCT